MTNVPRLRSNFASKVSGPEVSHSQLRRCMVRRRRLVPCVAPAIAMAWLNAEWPFVASVMVVRRMRRRRGRNLLRLEVEGSEVDVDVVVVAVAVVVRLVELAAAAAVAVILSLSL